MDLTPDQARQLLSQMDSGAQPMPQQPQQMSPDVARQLLGQISGQTQPGVMPQPQSMGQTTPPPSLGAQNSGLTPPEAGQGGMGQFMKNYLDSTLGKDYRTAKKGLGAAGSLVSGESKGLMDLAANIGQLEAKGVDWLTGSKLAGQAPQVQMPQAMQNIMQQYPKTAAVGEFIGQTAPLLASPGGELKMAARGIEALPEALQGAARFAGRLGKGAATGAAIAPVYQPDEDIATSMGQGAALGAGGVGLEGILQGIKYSPKLAGKLMGGTKSAEDVKSFMESLNRLGVKAPIAETIGSRGAAKLQKTGLKNIPGSGMSQAYSDISEGLSGQLENMSQKLNPDNVHAGQEAKSILTDTYKKSLQDVSNMYGDLESSVLDAAPGDIHTSDDMFKESNAMKSEFKEFRKLAGGDLKVPKSVESFIGEVEKSPKNLSSALRQDEIINEYIGDARSKASMGDREGKRELRYFNRLKASNLKDIDRTIEKTGSEDISNQWSHVKDFYKQNVVPFDKKGSVLGKIINPKTRDDEVQSLFLKKSGQQPKTQILKEVTDFLPQSTKDKLAHSQLTGPGDKGALSMIDEYEKLQPGQRSELFSPEDKQVFDDMLNVKKHIGKNEFNQMFVADTGSKMAHLIPAAAYGAGSAVGGPLAGLAATGGLTAAGRGAKSLAMSDALKSLYLKSLQETKQAPKVGRAALMGLPLYGNNRNK